MIQYLEALPVVPGVSKVHAAVTGEEQKEAAQVYYIPASVADKAMAGHVSTAYNYTR